jgi:ribokinase
MPASHTGTREHNLRLSDVIHRASQLTVSVLPDFFLDRIVSVPSIATLFKETKAKANVGGGNLRGYLQSEIRGGNATNLAFALATLSVGTRLYCIGNPIANAMLAERPENCQLHIIPGRPGLTVALEFPFKTKRVNVMVSDVGDLAGFDGRSLTRKDMRALKASDAIALVNWSANKKGNALAERVFSLKGRAQRLHFLDPADLAGAERRIKTLAKIANHGLIDVLSVNENEAMILSKALTSARLPALYAPMDVLHASESLYDELGVTIDIHTPSGSASVCGQGKAWVPTLRLVKGFETGAGDVWDSGDILGYLLHFPVYDRLQLANACAYLYVTSKSASHPTLKEVTQFLEGASDANRTMNNVLT